MLLGGVPLSSAGVHTELLWAQAAAPAGTDSGQR